MKQSKVPQPAVPFGSIEPHAELLERPPDTHLLYKVMRLDNMVSSIRDAYLHFNRVDRYRDFGNADSHDGEQFPADRERDASIMFGKGRKISLAECHQTSRARTYASCFSLENSRHIWDEYGKGDTVKVCPVFKFGKLRERLNSRFDTWALEVNGTPLQNIFSINYGIPKYVDWHGMESDERLNPIIYAYRKDRQFEREKELRITLSAFGMGHFTYRGRRIEFPGSIPLSFDFREAFEDGTIQEILYEPEEAYDRLKDELLNLKIRAAVKSC